MPDKLVQDHKGNVFSSEKEMCKYWNLGVSTYRNRRKNLGWSLEKALETPANFKNKKERPRVDHLGNKFEHFNQMCEYWGLNPGTVSSRLDSGVSLKEALETKPAPSGPKKDVVDHLGNTFPSERAMCKFWGVHPATFNTRIEAGKSLAEALAPATRKCKPATDHLGNVFPSEAAMCRFWGIGPTTFRCRLRSGMCLKEALERHIKVTRIKVKDHLGNEFKSFQEMARHWGISSGALQSRLDTGMNLKEALETPLKSRDPAWKRELIYNGIGEYIEAEQLLNEVPGIVRNGRIREGYEYLHLLANAKLNRCNYIRTAFISADLVAYYKVPWSKELKTTREIVEHKLPELLDQYDKANPKGTYQPMVGTVNPGYRQLERELLHGKSTLEQLLNKFNCTKEQFNTRIKGGASLDEAITGKKDILILREQGQKDKV